MDFDRLKLFRDIAFSRSVSKGASMNGISQSAVSQYLRDLEEHMGITLLDRGTRPLTVTEAGKLYLDMCRDTLNRRDEFQVALDLLKGQGEGVRAAVSASSNRSAVPAPGKSV
jgi:DNA-binding transcriptional LysR family regulator